MEVFQTPTGDHRHYQENKFMNKVLFIAGAIVLSASAFATTDDKKPKSIKCAVMNGKDVDIKAATEAKMFSDYKGNRYFFCCGGCPEAFKKDPAKFSKSAHIKTPKAPKKV